MTTLKSLSDLSLLSKPPPLSEVGDPSLSAPSTAFIEETTHSASAAPGGNMPPPPQWVFVTPAMAADLLSRNLPGNRNINAAAVEEWAEALRSGIFKRNGETIKISDQNRLLDGQHRLTACVKTEIGFWSVIVYGLPEDVYDTIDRGRRKTAAHTLYHAGIPNAPAIAAATRWIAAINSREVYPKEMPPSVILQFVQANPKLVDAAHAVKIRSGLNGLAPTSMLVAFWFVFSRVDEIKTTVFFDRLADGENLVKGNPVHTLRERLIRERAASSKIARGASRGALSVYTILAWNAYRTKQTLQYLRGPMANSEGEVKLPEVSGYKGHTV